MRLITDLHLHSKYSRAVSKQMVVPEIASWAAKKGIDVVGTGDFTHPAWIKELDRDLRPAEPGLFRYKDSSVRFMLSVETSHIYKRDEKVRKVHMLIFSPSFKVAKAINKALAKIGNISSDGRPILGLDVEELMKIVMGVSEDCLVIPAHIWTPWFSMFGSKSGFDSIEECFGEQAKHIYAYESGLSSDPPMNWRVGNLDSRTLVSWGDAHSLVKLGREATVFDCDLSYKGIATAIKKGQVVETLEFFPEEGKYHIDGHRDCNFSCHPKQTSRLKGRCPECNSALVVGVLARVNDLATRSEDHKVENRPCFRRLIPLAEILADVYQVGPATKTVMTAYDRLIAEFGSEFNILLDIPVDEFEPDIGRAIERMRKGEVDISPGFDGQFGVVKIFGEEELNKTDRSRTLF